MTTVEYHEEHRDQGVATCILGGAWLAQVMVAFRMPNGLQRVAGWNGPVHTLVHTHVVYSVLYHNCRDGGANCQHYMFRVHGTDFHRPNTGPQGPVGSTLDCLFTCTSIEPGARNQPNVSAVNNKIIRDEIVRRGRDLDWKWLFDTVVCDEIRLKIMKCDPATGHII